MGKKSRRRDCQLRRGVVEYEQGKRKEHEKETMNDGDHFRLKVLGTRGSIPVSGREYGIFGGSTSCYQVEAGQERIFLDAGSGLVHATEDMPNPPIILLSHLHLDHILGLGVYPRLLREGAVTKLLVPVDAGESPLDVLNAVYSPPYWPLSLTAYRGTLRLDRLSFPVVIGEVRVDGMPGNHPGGCMAFRLAYRGRSLVYLTDYEPEPASFQALSRFAEGTDLLLYDGQYSVDQYSSRQGFGHSATDHALTMMRQSGAKRMLLIHHDPGSTDEILLDRENRLGLEKVRYAREGETIEL